MKNSIPEVDAFEFKAKKMVKILKRLATETQNEYINLNFVSDYLSIEETEMKSLIYYLRRGEIIKTDIKTNKIKLTEYGEIIYGDYQKEAYAPIIC